jgi:MFS family permease
MSEPAHPGEPPMATRAASLVVLGAGALLFSCFGTAYAVPVFFSVLSQALAIPLPHLIALFSAAGALYFVLGVASGPLADRIGAHIVAAVGCAVLACGLIVMSRAGSERVFDIGYFLGIGAGVGLCFVPTVGAVQALCRKNPAIAGGVAASGIGLGTFVMPSLAQLMINYVGWRQTLLLMSVLAACGGLAVLPLARPGTRNEERSASRPARVRKPTPARRVVAKPSFPAALRGAADCLAGGFRAVRPPRALYQGDGVVGGNGRLSDTNLINHRPVQARGTNTDTII